MNRTLLSARALLDRARRDDLFSFTVAAFCTINPGSRLVPNWHIEAIVHQLERVRRGETRRLIINQPPRSLKSLCVSVAFVAYLLGHDPSLKILVVSYSGELAGELARQFRVVIDCEWYRRIFPRMRAAKDTGAELVTSAGGGRLAISVGGSITGRGADIIIIDDPLNADQATSRSARENVVKAYRGSLVSRLNDKAKGSIIVVMQRLHEEDLTGVLLEDGGWDHLCLGAIAAEREVVQLGPAETYIRQANELLQPEREPLAVLEQIKAEIGSFAFNAQYLQRPVPLEGNLIKAEWLRDYEHPPAHDTNGVVVQSWDTALKPGIDNDHSVCTTWLKKGTDYYLLHVLRGRFTFPQLLPLVVDHAVRFGTRTVLIEDTASGTPLIQALHDKRGRVRPVAIAPKGDKATRMAAHSAMFEAGQVHLPKSAPWRDDYISELLAFPYGRHDDQVDSTSQFLQWAKEQSRRRGIYSTPSYLW